MADIILRGKKPVVPVDGEAALKDMKIVDTIYEALKRTKKVKLNL